MRANAVFEGGGVKGIGLAGAVAEMEAAGYRWLRVAGTSAGALVASLLAAGYTGAEMGQLLHEEDFRRFADRDCLPPVVALAMRGGVYRGLRFEAWLRDLLAARGIRCFGDLEVGEHPRQYPLQVIASDLSLRRVLVLPRDASRYGLDPDRLDVARAVRMSASVPFFYEPVRLARFSGQSVIVDGGLLSNFPIWLVDTNGKPTHPAFGFRLIEPSSGRPTSIRGPLSLTLALVSTMLQAHDQRHLEERDWVRTVAIPTLGVGTLEFDLSSQRKRELFAAGREAARRFLQTWSFPAYLAKYGCSGPRKELRRPGGNPFLSATRQE